MSKKGLPRSFRYPAPDLRDQVRAAVKERGFRFEKAFWIAACEHEFEKGDNTEATAQREAPYCRDPRESNSREVQSRFTLAHSQFALTNSLLQYARTCMIEPPDDMLPCCTSAREAQTCKDSPSYFKGVSAIQFMRGWYTYRMICDIQYRMETVGYPYLVVARARNSSLEWYGARRLWVIMNRLGPILFHHQAIRME